MESLVQQDIILVSECWLQLASCLIPTCVLSRDELCARVTTIVSAVLQIKDSLHSRDWQGCSCAMIVMRVRSVQRSILSCVKSEVATRTGQFSTLGTIFNRFAERLLARHLRDHHLGTSLLAPRVPAPGSSPHLFLDAGNSWGTRKVLVS